MNCALQSQSSTPRTDTLYGQTVVRKLLIRAQQADLMQQDIDSLSKRINEKELQLALNRFSDSLTADALRFEIRTLRDQRGIFEGEIKALQKQLKRARAGKRWTAIAGIVTTVAAGLLIK